VRLLAIACVLGTFAIAHADGGTVRGTVDVARPKTLASSSVLVYVVGFTEKPAAAQVVIKQVKKTFVPDLVGVTAGGSVAFPNGDPFLHNVFSQTTERAFDLGSYKQNESRSRSFPKPGVIEVYCNLHPEMSATIVVLPNTRFVVAAADGSFEIKDVPAGTWTVFAFSRHAAQPSSAKVTVAAGAAVDIKLHLDEVQRDVTHRNKYGETYRPTTTYPPGT
jgi:plastocyanin